MCFKRALNRIEINRMSHYAFNSAFSKPMVWSYENDDLLRREILVIDSFTGTKRGTVAKRSKWQEVPDNLNKIQQVYFKVDKRAVFFQGNELQNYVQSFSNMFRK